MVRPKYLTDWDERIVKEDFWTERKTKNESSVYGFCLVNFDSPFFKPDGQDDFGDFRKVCESSCTDIIALSFANLATDVVGEVGLPHIYYIALEKEYHLEGLPH
jgi:hypothetical protein